MAWAAKTDTIQPLIVEVARKMGASVFLTHRVGGGFPDLVVGFAGHNILVECKSPGGKLNRKERQFFENWRGQAYIIRSPEEMIQLLEDIMNAD